MTVLFRIFVSKQISIKHTGSVFTDDFKLPRNILNSMKLHWAGGISLLTTSKNTVKKMKK